MKPGYLFIIFLLTLYGAPVSGAGPLTGEAFKLTDQAYKAIATGDLEQAATSVEEALRLRPDHPQLLALLAQVQSLRNDNEAAARTLDQALAIEPDNARMLAQRGYLRISRNHHDGAITDFRDALQTGQLTDQEARNIAMALADLHAGNGHYQEAARTIAPYVTASDTQATAKWQSYLIHDGNLPPDNALIDSPEVNYALVSTGYEALRKADEVRALELFQIAERHGGLTALQYGDAGYAARKLFYNKEADRLFKAAIDANHSEPDQEQSYAPRELFGLRRAVDDLNRNWGLIISDSISPGGQTGLGTIGLPGFARGRGNKGDINQIGSEVYFQPPGIGYRDGRQLQFFVRSFQTLDDQSGGAEGIETNQGSLGVRWKPLRDYNLVLTSERLIGIGKLADDDWLLRVGFSLDEGVDIKPYLDHWPYRTLFVEAAYFIDQARNIDNLEARWGHSFRVPVADNLTFTPHLVFAVDVDTAAVEKTAAGIGIGASTRWWFRESLYRAPASYVDFTVQYREGLIEDAIRQDGTFFRFTLWY